MGHAFVISINRNYIRSFYWHNNYHEFSLKLIIFWLNVLKDALEDVTLSQSASSTTSSAPPTSAISKKGALGILDIDNCKLRRETSLDYHDCGQHPDELLPTESASSEDDEEDEEIGKVSKMHFFLPIRLLKMFSNNQSTVDYCAGHSHFSIEVLDEAFNMSVDDVFHHCFSDSQIYREFVKAKKTLGQLIKLVHCQFINY